MAGATGAPGSTSFPRSATRVAVLSRGAIVSGATSQHSTDNVVREVLAHDLGAWLKFDPVTRVGKDPEGVHQLRVNARRMRAELKIFAPVIGRRDRQQLNAELRWIGQILGGQRDLDVLEQLLLDSQSPERPLDENVFKELRRRSAREQRQVRRALASKRYSALLGELTRFTVRPPLLRSARRPAREILLPGLQDSLSVLFDQVNNSGPIPSDESLHLIRIKSKQGRYCAEVSAKFMGKLGESVALDLAKVQGVLGDLHDRTVALDYLRQFAGAPSADESIGDDTPLGYVVHGLYRSSDDLRRAWRAPMTRARRRSTALFLDAEGEPAPT